MNHPPPIEISELASSFTSDTSKFFWHQDVMEAMRNGQGKPIVSHIMPTDLCDRFCAFCSVQRREKDHLSLEQVRVYLEQLVPLGLKAVIISGGGNPLLSKCKESGSGFNEYIELIHSFGLQIGLICNGLKMKKYPCGRTSWITCKPETLDKISWIRISMAGLDHDDKTVAVPDIDPTKTTLGFSYVYHDIYIEPADRWHGRVSVPEEVTTPLKENDNRIILGVDRKDWLTEQIKSYVDQYQPKYVRLIPNCLEPKKIDQRCKELQEMADIINPEVAFVQWKPPAAPKNCWLGWVHPVLVPSGDVLPCDSCCLNPSAGHSFGNPWKVARWDNIGEMYKRKIHSLVDPQKWCSGCVFTRQNEVLEAVVNGGNTPQPDTEPFHSAFV